MFCPVCGCELPAVARFCVKCGSTVGPGSAQLPPTSSRGELGTLYCVGCGHPYNTSHRFCNACGRATSNTSIASIATTEAAPALSTSAEVNSAAATAAVQQLDPIATSSPIVEFHPLSAEAVPTHPFVSAPYATFVIFAIASALGASVIAFALSDGAARGQWTASPVSVIATVVCLVFVNSAVRKAAALRVMGAADPEVLIRRKKLIRRTMFFAVLFVGTAVLVGTEIGISGAETNRLISDIDQMSRLGDRISSARNAAERTVPAQVQMYKSIEPDVEQLSSVLNRLHDEYPIYDDKYPSQHETITNALRGVDTGTTRMNLLRQQIATAKEIASIDDSDEQFRVWQRKMQPLLDREDELDRTK